MSTSDRRKTENMTSRKAHNITIWTLLDYVRSGQSIDVLLAKRWCSPAPEEALLQLCCSITCSCQEKSRGPDLKPVAT